MLPLPNLDDRSFKKIVEESRKMIPNIMPEWTDENYHDPGITFIELFAWLTEMQEYYLNRITAHSQIKFLKLLGIKIKEAGMAHTDLTLSGVTRAVKVLQGTKVLARDQVFETDEELLLLPINIEKIIVYSDIGARDYTSFNNNNGLSFYAFGRESRKNNRFCIGIDNNLPVGETISFKLQLFEDYPIGMEKIEDEEQFIPSATVSWTYYGESADGEGFGWHPVKIVKDESRHLCQSGYLRFEIPGSMKAARMHMANDRDRYWLVCTIEHEGYEISPRIEEISLNTVPVCHRDRISEIITFSSDGKSGQSFKASSYLSFYGLNRLQVQNKEECWSYYFEKNDLSDCTGEDEAFTLDKDIENKEIIIRFGNGENGAIPPKGTDNIRLISFLPPFERQRFVGRSNGLPGQRFILSAGPYLQEDLLIQVGRKDDDRGGILWQDWQIVDDFDASRPGDRHCLVDAETGELVFGNNENGIIPEKADSDNSDNIVIISCQKGGGERGNVKQNEINQFYGPLAEVEDIKAANHFPATGGTERESLEEAKKRVIKELKEQERAVCPEDFERIARATPGLRVARAKAIPLFSPASKSQAPAQVTVVVVPFSEEQKPVPSKGFLETVGRHLDAYRLITTEVHVIPPEYVKIMVYAVVVVSSGLDFNVQKVIDELEGFLRPLDKKDGSRAWPFGRTVYKGDVYGLINKIEGVEYIKDLWLDAEGAEFKKELSGDIKIPPYALVYLGEHEIEVINRQDL